VRTTFPVVAPPEAWAALADPQALAAALPGCRSVTRDADRDGTLHVVTELAVASVRGMWAGTVAPVDGDAVRVRGSGEPGSVDLVVRADPGRTTVAVEGTIEGPLATVGSSVLASATRRTAQDLLTVLSAPAAAAQSEVEEIADARRQLFPRPRRSRRISRTQGEIVAAAGVVLAIVIRRRRRRAG
jgi:carbon monoxide dehydrogenase subunit G